jgi:hypothetical protein
MFMKITHAVFAIVLVSMVFAGAFEDFSHSVGDLFDRGTAKGEELFHGFVIEGKAAADTPFGWIWSSGSCENATGGWTSNPIQTWLGPAAIAVMLVTLISALVYMFGQGLQSQNLINSGKDGLFEVLITALRIGFIMLAIASADKWYAIAVKPSLDPAGVYGAAAVAGLPTMIDGAMAFSRLIVYESSKDYSFMLIYNMIIHTIYSATMWFGVTWRAMYSFNLGPVLKPLIDLLGFVLQFLSVSIGEWVLHLITLCLIKKWTWSALIPIGIFARSLPPTRTAGDALVALIFAFSVIYPAMFLLDYEIYNITKGALVNSQTAVGSFIDDSGIGGVTTVLIGVAFLTAGAIFPFFVNAGLSIAIELVRNAIYYVVIMGLLLPFINIFVTLTAAKETARFFNIDVNFMAFVKII